MRGVGWGTSDVGRKPHHNEDSFLCNNQIPLYAVADGMGGHLGGERASRMAIEIIDRELETAWRSGLLADVAPVAGAPTSELAPATSLLKKAVVVADKN